MVSDIPAPPRHSRIDRISAFPILDRDLFTVKFEETYGTLSPDHDFLWCATVNTVLAIGCRANPASHADQTCSLFSNALSLFAKIALSSSTLPKIQTLCLMVSSATSSGCPTSMLTMLAVSISQLHFSAALGLLNPCTGGQGKPGSRSSSATSKVLGHERRRDPPTEFPLLDFVYPRNSYANTTQCAAPADLFWQS